VYLLGQRILPKEFEVDLKYGKKNLIVGAIGLAASGLAGAALGITFDAQSVQEGNHLLSLSRFYMREGHSHSMPMAMINLIVGLLIDRWLANDTAKKIASYSAMATFVLPIGLALKGFAGAPADYPPIGMVGVVGFLVMAFTLIFAKKQG
jgi:hypothetical protein